jgi:hypothetical protein
MDILAQYVQTLRHATIVTAAIIQGHAQAYHLRHVSGAQPAIEESMYHGPRNAQRE